MFSRVVITGYGTISPLGSTVEKTWQGLIYGRSGIDYITLFDATDYNVKIAAEVKDFDPLDYIDATTARYTDRFTQFAMAASLQAVEKANLTIDDSNRYDISILIGSGVGGIGTLLHQVGVLNTRGPAKVSPYTIPMLIVDNAPSRVSIQTGIRGANFSLVSACSTGTDAIGIAYQMIKCGEWRAVLAGGTDAGITPLGVAGFSQAGALSRNPNPDKASRPFDALRDGFIIGEGAAVLVLENLDDALKRGAPILAEIIGYGATSDAYHITQPSEDVHAAAKAIELSLANVNPGEIDYISAHGTSTPLNDSSETKAIKQVFGQRAYAIPASSIKSMVGHMIGAAGALEAIICCEIINKGILPPTINLENPDPQCDLDYVPNTARHQEVHTAISNSFGFGGHNSVLAIRRYR